MAKKNGLSVTRVLFGFWLTAGWLSTGCQGGIYSCEDITCSGHGTCEAHEDGARCACEPGYVETAGPDCELEPDSVCAEIDCSGHGTCREEDGKATCLCHTGYHPEGPACVEDDACLGVDCGPNGSCVPVADAPTCGCDPGYLPEGLTCKESDPCADIDCGPHGSCQGFEGVASCTCEPGFHPDGLTCTEDDPCEGITCGSHAHCQAGSCVCDAGYQGDPATACQEVGSEEERVRNELVDLAEAELGMCEGRDDRPYMLGQPGLWCYDFVAWVHTQADEGLPQPQHLPLRTPADLEAGWRPSSGDLIKFTYQHYGMVKSVSESGDRVTTLEGNVGGCVTSRVVSLANVEFYGTLEEFFE